VGVSASDVRNTSGRLALSVIHVSITQLGLLIHRSIGCCQ